MTALVAMAAGALAAMAAAAAIVAHTVADDIRYTRSLRKKKNR